MQSRLNLDPVAVREARELAARAGQPIVEMARTHTTVSVERAVLRLAGLAGADNDGMPLVNHLVDAVRQSAGLEHGVALPAWDAMLAGGYHDLAALAEAAALGKVAFRLPSGEDAAAARTAAQSALRGGIGRIDASRARRQQMIDQTAEPGKPWIYLIVATGDIYEDIPQAQAAAREGADIIAVIRSTGQSLLDYVPEGATREGYAGTYATQENFRLMRAALDETSRELGRYVRLTNYASGLCMPEIAALAGLERLDMMLNDCMYGIIFRDINPRRTFIDQRFARQIHARAGIIINTGEDNYLTTADAVEQAPAVLASQFINERLAVEAGLEPWQIGLGHAFEIDPTLEDGLLYEIAQAEAAREIFPDSPLKYMPPTKHMTGNVFRGYQQNALFMLTSVATNQSIHLLGMLTEALHTPFLHDRWLAIDQARIIRKNARHLAEEISFRSDGRIVQRAREVLEDARRLLQKIAAMGLFAALEAGVFADTRRPRSGGRGADGILPRDADYSNPFLEAFDRKHAGAAP